MPKFKLGRRAVLQAFGTSMVLKLCPLEAMFDSNGKAWGQVGAAPKRFVLFYQGNGVPAKGHHSREEWVPLSSGAGLTLNTSMTALAPMKSHLRVVTGIHTAAGGSGPAAGGEPHANGLTWSLTGLGATSPGSALGGPTPDFIAAKTLAGTSPVKQLMLGLCRGVGFSPGRKKITADDNGNLIDVEYSPQTLFNKLFGNFTVPGTVTVANPELDRQKLIIDAVKRDADRLSGQLGVTDRIRLDAYLTGITDLQKALFPSGQSQQPMTSSCAKPSDPGAAADVSNDVRAKALMDLTALAFACDLTRVVSIMGTPANSEENLGFLGTNLNFHDQVSHPGNRGDAFYYAEMAKVTNWHLKWFNYLMQKLSLLQEPGGTLLDSTLGVFTSEFGNSDNHSQYELPYAMIGGSQFIGGDFHWRAPGANAVGQNGARSAQVWLSVLKALGCPATSFGGNSISLALK
jgi:hypothetical protein